MGADPKATALVEAKAHVAAASTNGEARPTLLSRAAILAADDIPAETVKVPEWGGHVLVRGMTGIVRDAFERSMLDVNGDDVKTNWQNLRAKLVARSIVDNDGHTIFNDNDIPALGAKSAVALQRVFEVAQRLSGLTDDHVEELTTDLKVDQNSGSGSD